MGKDYEGSQAYRDHQRTITALELEWSKEERTKGKPHRWAYQFYTRNLTSLVRSDTLALAEALYYEEEAVQKFDASWTHLKAMRNKLFSRGRLSKIPGAVKDSKCGYYSYIRDGGILYLTQDGVEGSKYLPNYSFLFFPETFGEKRDRATWRKKFTVQEKTEFFGGSMEPYDSWRLAAVYGMEDIPALLNTKLDSVARAILEGKANLSEGLEHNDAAVQEYRLADRINDYHRRHLGLYRSLVNETMTRVLARLGDFKRPEYREQEYHVVVLNIPSFREQPAKKLLVTVSAGHELGILFYRDHTETVELGD